MLLAQPLPGCWEAKMPVRRRRWTHHQTGATKGHRHHTKQCQRHYVSSTGRRAFFMADPSRSRQAMEQLKSGEQESCKNTAPSSHLHLRSGRRTKRLGENESKGQRVKVLLHSWSPSHTSALLKAEEGLLSRHLPALLTHAPRLPPTSC